MAARPVVLKTAAARMGGGRFLFGVFILMLAGAPAAPAAPDDEGLLRVRALIRGGATQLALRVLDQSQPAAARPGPWMDWEKERYALYRAQRDWPRLAERVTSLPDDLPAGFIHWANTEAARAWLNAGQPEAARRQLRALLWSGEGSREQQAEWRQLVIRSYLLEDNVEDAHTALVRYRADFQVSSPAWRQLEATILIRAGKARAAYALVGDIKTHEGRLITLLAALRAGLMTPGAVLARSLILADETRNRHTLNHQAWVLAAEAALRANDGVRRIYALERALTGAREHAAPDHLLVVRADDLWQAYERYAEALGNEARLLIGRDAVWIKKAESYKRDDAMHARAFYAFLATRAATPDNRRLAVQRLADSLIEDGRGEVLRGLFTASSRYPELDSVPEFARYRLADLALADYDIRLAAQLMHGLETAPNGENPDLWALRRARVLIYAARYPDAVGLLKGILGSKPKLEDAFAERYLQVVFDLQAADRHADAIGLLELLMRQVDSPRIRREILYWIADSRQALGDPQQAAELYLRSASYEHPTGGDMWGQTARFHAAGALAKAGLTQDARLVYQALLRHTEDAKQRAVLERNIQQLWLIEKKSTTP